MLVRDNTCHHNKIGIAARYDTCVGDHGLNRFLRNTLSDNDENDPDVQHTNKDECRR